MKEIIKKVLDRHKDSQGNMSEIIATDVAGSNGVIHVINSVVMPK